MSCNGVQTTQPPAVAAPAETPSTPRAAPDSPPLRVLLLASSYWPIIGGGETHSRLVAKTLARHGVTVSVLTQRRLADSSPREMDGPVPIERVGAPNRDRFGKHLIVPTVIRRLLARRAEYDVIYSCGMRALGAAAVVAGKLAGKPVVLRSESCEELSGRHMFEHLTGPWRVAGPLLRAAIVGRNLILRRAPSFMAISGTIAKEYRACGVPDAKVSIIYNGIDLSGYRPCASEREKIELRSRLKLPADATLMTYTGKLNRGKGLEHLLEAMRQLAPRRPNLHLVLVGSGAHMATSVEPRLKSFVQQHQLEDRVTFTGYRTDVVDFLQASDLFAMPSEMESLCISLIEALACGLPSVACAVGGIPEVARHDEEALLVPPADPAALAQAIDRLLDDASLRARLVEAGQRRVAECFDIESVAEQHETLFRRLLSARAGSPHTDLADGRAA